MTTPAVTRTVNLNLVEFNQANSNRKLQDTTENTDENTNTNTDTTSNIITGSQLYKAGQCFYNSNNNLSLEPHINIDFISSKIDIKIYNNPIFDNTINFGENLSWGCSEKLSLTDLKLLCINQLWKQKMIYNLFNNITYVGEFGNPERHFILDWIKIDDFDINTYQSIWDDSTNKCLVPSIINLDIVYANYGLVNNTQAGILKVTKRLESAYWYGVEDDSLLVPDNNSFNNANYFHTHVRINFFKVSQSTVWFFAPGPKPVYPKNIMYPFRVGKTQYWKNKSNFLTLKDSVLILLSVILFLIN